MRTHPLLASACAAVTLLIAVAMAMPHGTAQSPTPFASLVDGYLDRFAQFHPSIAAGNGLHQHDDLLDDFTAPGIAAEIAALRRDAETLAAFDTASCMTTGRTVTGCCSSDPRHPEPHRRRTSESNGPARRRRF